MARLINNQKGQLVIEVLVAFGLSIILIPALLGGYIATSGGKPQETQRIAALGLLKEEEEALRSVRESGWIKIATKGTYYPKISDSHWVLTTNLDDGNVNGYSRSINIADAFRDVSGHLSLSGNFEPSSKYVTLTVSWGNLPTQQVSNSYYLTRYLDDTIWFQTTVSDFTGASPNLSTLTNTQITNNNGGEVQLDNGVGGWGDWCNPNLNITGLNLTRQSVPTAISSSYGHVYTANGLNASGNSLDSVNISDPPAPTSPVATEANSYNNFKSNGIFADPDHSRVYLTTSHPGLTVDVVSTSNFTQVDTFSASGGQLGNGIYVVGSVGYVTTSNNNGTSPALYTFDTTQTPAKELGHISLNGVGNRIVVFNNIAYVATSNTSNQLQIFDVSNPASIRLVNSVSVGNGGKGIDVTLDTVTLTAYLTTDYISSLVDDVFKIDLSNYNVTNLYNTGGMNPNGIVFIPGGWLVVVGSSGSPYQVFDLTKSQTNPCGSLASIPGATAVYAVSYVQEPDGDVFSYILTDNASQEFDMIAGGPGGSGGRYFSSGTFESNIFSSPTGADVVFNRFNANVTPNGQTVSVQLAGAHMINGSCSGVSFTYMTVSGTSGPIPLSDSQSGYANPAGCFRYKVTFYTNNVSESPILNDMSINYSP